MLRLDFPPDASLPNQCAGRASNGNFVINEVKVLAGGKPLPLVAAWSDYAETASSPDQAIDGKRTGRLVIQAHDPRLGKRRPQRLDHRGKSLLDDQHLDLGIAQNEHLLGHRQPPVERHQQRAEPGTGMEQHEIIGMIGGEDADPVAAPDAAL